jgi:hypothetical protein
MNNGENPMSINNQISFYNSSGEISFGMEAMHRPHNGQLIVGRNRIVLIFAHYNNFDANEGGVDNHTGDTVISFDMNGSDILMGTSWDTSHSLTQRLVYDGLQFVTTSLGDAYPQQITFTKSDGKYTNGYVDGNANKENRFDFTSKSDVIPGTIPGNGTGKACGKLGGLHVFSPGGFQNYAQVYSRVPCPKMFGSVEANNVDEAAIIYFDRELKMLEKKKFLKGKDINVLKSANYGKNVFVLFSTTDRDADSSFEPNTYRVDQDTCKMVLLKSDFDGTVESDVIELDNYIVNNDNPITLSDGNVAWSFVDSSNVLKIYTLQRPASTVPASGSTGGSIGAGGGSTGGGNTGGGDTGGGNTGGGNTGGGDTGGGNTGGGDTGGGDTGGGDTGGGDTSGGNTGGGNTGGGDTGGGNTGGGDTGGDDTSGGNTGGGDTGGGDTGGGDTGGDNGGNNNTTNPHTHVHDHPYTDPNHTHGEMILNISMIILLHVLF